MLDTCASQRRTLTPGISRLYNIYHWSQMTRKRRHECQLDIQRRERLLKEQGGDLMELQSMVAQVRSNMKLDDQKWPRDERDEVVVVRRGSNAVL